MQNKEFLFRQVMSYSYRVQLQHNQQNVQYVTKHIYPEMKETILFLTAS